MNIRHSNILGHSAQSANPSLANPLRAMERRASRRGARRGASGFTLVELMVVLAIMAIVMALTVGTFRSLSDNNQRTGCQANLAQVYQGLRLYMADEGGQAPRFDPSKGATDVERNIGLWNLWTFPEQGKEYNIAPVGTAPKARYLRSPNLLHCPSDVEPGAIRPNIELYTDKDKTAYNPDFLSYQMYATEANMYSSLDTAADIALADTQATYLPVRTTSTTDKAKFQRQLRQPIASPPAGTPDFYRRPPLDSTVVTWCRHHRYARDYDNVLFFDGSVQLLPREQDNFKEDCSVDSTNPILRGADRVPRRSACD